MLLLVFVLIFQVVVVGFDCHCLNRMKVKPYHSSEVLGSSPVDNLVEVAVVGATSQARRGERGKS